jgi:hypothetical protein
VGDGAGGVKPEPVELTAAQAKQDARIRAAGF